MIKKLIIAILGIIGLSVSLNMKLSEKVSDSLSTAILIISVLIIIASTFYLNKRKKRPL